MLPQGLPGNIDRSFQYYLTFPSSSTCLVIITIHLVSSYFVSDEITPKVGKDLPWISFFHESITPCNLPFTSTTKYIQKTRRKSVLLPLQRYRVRSQDRGVAIGTRDIPCAETRRMMDACKARSRGRIQSKMLFPNNPWELARRYRFGTPKGSLPGKRKGRHEWKRSTWQKEVWSY